MPAAVPEPKLSAPHPAARAAPDLADTPAGQHAQRWFEAVHALTDVGRSHRAAARELGLDRRTVGKYARAATWQDCIRRVPRRPSSLDAYRGYLQQRWDDGEHNAKLHQELAAKGYRGHYQRVKMAVAPLRQGLALAEPHEHPPSPREVARWITAAPDRRSLATEERLRRLLGHCPELDRAHALVRRFATMLETGDAGLLPDWLNRLVACRLPALASLAKVIREDQAAVIQGITTSFSSGVNEGRITDVKLQKRIMGGRAGVALLRQRVVLIAHLRRRYPDHSAAPR